MDFQDFLGPNVDVVDLHAQDRWQAIDELINHLVVTRKIPTQHRNQIDAAAEIIIQAQIERRAAEAG